MANPANSTVQNLLPVQAYFSVDGEFQTFIGQGQPFTAIIDPDQSGLNITNSTINSTTIGATTPSTGVFSSGQVLATPSGSTDIANKLYVDSVASGLSWKQPFQVATTVNLASRSGFPIIDTYQTVAGDRVLVKNQTNAAENGIYIASSGAWAYAPDGDNWEEYVSAIGFVEYGSQLGSAWYCSAQSGGTLGVTNMNWSNFSVAGTYFAGTGLTLSAYTFSITNTGVTAATYGSASSVPVVAVNAQGQITSATNTTIAIANTQVSGLGTMSTQAANSVAITGGTINGTAIGGSTAAAVTGTTITAGTQFTGPGTGLTGTATSLSIGGNAATATSATSATTATNLAGGAAGSLPYQTAAGATAFLTIGANGTVLTSDGTSASWQALPAGMVYPASGIANSTGTAWGTSYSTTGTGTVVALATSPTISSPTIGGANPYANFADGTAVTVDAGRLWYNGTTGSWNAGMGGGNITQQIGEEIFVYGKASAAITDSPLQCVYQTGVVGASGVIQFAPTIAGITDGEAIIGIATESIALNGFGRVTSFGTVRGITTNGTAYGETWVDGDKIWYNPVTGGLTKVKPVAPNIKVQVGIVISAGSGGSGSFSVELAHGTELGGTDSNVQLSSPTGGQLLTYNQTAGYWQNTSLTAGSNVTITPATGGGITIAASGGLTVTDDTTTNATRYLTFTSATSGTITGINTGSTELTWNPGTSVLDLSGSTGALNLPRGTTAQRPSTTTAGTGLRYNTTTGFPEIYTTNGWYKIVPIPFDYLVSYLIVAGGGGSGYNGNVDVGNAGGGAGGLLSATNVTFNPGVTYTITVGAGGGYYSNGGNSSISGFTAAVGGGGGGGSGNAGGSGGGASGDCGAGGAGTAGQGNKGGDNFCRGGGNYGATGGGGAGGAGSNSPGDYVSGSAGGVGVASSITGTSIFYAGGGGGHGQQSNGAGGNGGGGFGGGSSGTANTGGGGGGFGGVGGSGVVILSIPTVSYTGTVTGGPTVTTSGTNTIVRYTSSGTYVG